jgi:HAD superfamily hydrolase (TIGR01509 family)
MNKNIQGIIFDLDGTLVDTEGYQWKGWVVCLKKLGIDLTIDDYLEYAGKAAILIEEEIVKRYRLDIEKGFLVNEKAKLLKKWFSEEELSFTPFAEEAVRYCLDSGYKIGLCSGGPREEVMLKIKRKGLDAYFDIIVTGSDVSRNKPFPDIYLKALKEMGFKASNCVAIEDSQYGLQAAKDAELKCFVVPHALSVRQDFSRADKVLSSLEDLINYLRNE